MSHTYFVRGFYFLSSGFISSTHKIVSVAHARCMAYAERGYMAPIMFLSILWSAAGSGHVVALSYSSEPVVLRYYD
jgi:hypothetical protein